MPIEIDLHDNTSQVRVREKSSQTLIIKVINYNYFSSNYYFFSL